MDRAPGGARAPGSRLPLAASPVDDPAILMATPQRREPQPTQPNQLHPQHRRMLEQSQNRNRQNRDRNDNRNRQNHRRPRDPYANLMSKREREWITSMQLRALEIKNPEVEDYYYVNYMRRPGVGKRAILPYHLTYIPSLFFSLAFWEKSAKIMSKTLRLKLQADVVIRPKHVSL